MGKTINLNALAIVSMLSFVLSGCNSSADITSTSNSQIQGKLTITGSSTVAPLASEIAKKFEQQNPKVRIDVQTGGSSRGIADVNQGLADIGMVSRSLNRQERKNFYSFVIARDGIGIIVNQTNSVQNLKDEDIKQIYIGKINNWQELGGEDAPITVVNKAEGRSTLELFLQYFQLKNSEISADIIIGDNQQGIKTVAGNKFAIGYVSIGAAEFEISQGTSLKLLPIGGVKANHQNVANSSFPLSRPLNLITQTKPQGLTKAFIDFAQSQEVYDLVKQQNFIPISPETLVKQSQS